LLQIFNRFGFLAQKLSGCHNDLAVIYFHAHADFLRGHKMFRMIRGCMVLVLACFAILAQAQDFEATKRAAEQGSVQAQFSLGERYRRGQGVAQDDAEAAKWYQKAAEQGHAEAQYILAQAQDFEVTKRAAERGDAKAQYNLGVMYKTSGAWGGSKNYFEAVKWFRKAAEQGFTLAQYSLGGMYAFGQGVAKDNAEAVKWYRKAAEQGNAAAQYNLGKMYLDGLGVARSHVEATKWWRKAAEQGNANAQDALDKMYENGEDIAQNNAGATKAIQTQGSTTAPARTPQEIARKSFASTVLLVMTDANGRAISQGSGFLVRSGAVASNMHVVEGVTRGYAKLIDRETRYPIEGIIAIDSARDLVVLRVPISGVPALPLGNSNAVEVGESVYAVGNPQGLEGTFSQGIVSSIRADRSGKLIQITAPISEGSSGGPVLNAKGEVIGISFAIYKKGQNLNFAIPSNDLKALLNR
jgi:TPR repeat protein